MNESGGGQGSLEDSSSNSSQVEGHSPMRELPRCCWSYPCPRPTRDRELACCLIFPQVFTCCSGDAAV